MCAPMHARSTGDSFSAHIVPGMRAVRYANCMLLGSATRMSDTMAPRLELVALELRDRLAQSYGDCSFQKVESALENGRHPDELHTTVIIFLVDGTYALQRRVA